MLGLVRTIFFIVAAYYIIRFISRVLLPYFRAVSEINERQKRDDRAPVQYTEVPKKKRVADEGEYIEYKEIE